MFTEFEFPPEFTTPEGLAPQRLRNLKQLVVLAGPNGAGKSRYLKLVGTIATKAHEVMRRAREQIRWIRETGKNGSTYKLGRKHAHFTLLYANAQLALEQYPVGG